MKRSDLKPGHVYRVVPIRGNASSYRGTGAYAQTPAGDELATVMIDRKYQANETRVVFEPCSTYTHDGYAAPFTVRALDITPDGVRPASVIDEVCPVDEWPATLAKMAKANHYANVEHDAHVLMRREDVMLLVAGILAAGHDPEADEWRHAIDDLVGLSPDVRHEICRTLGWHLGPGTSFENHKADAQAWVQQQIDIALDHEGYHYAAKKLVGKLSTEDDGRVDR